MTVASLATVRRTVAAASRQVTYDRVGGLAALEALFRSGTPPGRDLDGRYPGALVTPSLHPLLDAAGRAFTRLWLPWLGKTFDARAQRGDNIFTNNGLPLSRLLWPSYLGVIPDGPGRSRACVFRTWRGPGQLDPDREVFKIDYDLDVNPFFLIRDVLDELVQLDDGFYLGKALLRRPGDWWVCAAYFTLTSPQ